MHNQQGRGGFAESRLKNKIRMLRAEKRLAGLTHAPDDGDHDAALLLRFAEAIRLDQSHGVIKGDANDDAGNRNDGDDDHWLPHRLPFNCFLIVGQ